VTTAAAASTRVPAALPRPKQLASALAAARIVERIIEPLRGTASAAFRKPATTACSSDSEAASKQLQHRRSAALLLLLLREFSLFCAAVQRMLLLQRAIKPALRHQQRCI
jgi:hypothetical protein